MTAEERQQMGKKGRQFVEKEYSLESYVENWDNAFTQVRETFGSWDTRKGYKNYVLEAV